jgi:hypothetical protein
VADELEQAREREEQAREAWEWAYNAMQDACSLGRWCPAFFSGKALQYHLRLNIAWELQQARLREWCAAIQARRLAESEGVESAAVEVGLAV